MEAIKKENSFLDLSKLSEEQQKHIFSLLPKPDDVIEYDIFEQYTLLHYDENIDTWYVEDVERVRGKTELAYSEFIKLFEEPTKLPSELLKEYFKNTPREQVLKDWESTSDYDNVNSPKVLELFKGGDGDSNGWIKIESESDLPKEVGDYWAVWKDGEVGRKQFFCRTVKNIYSPKGNISEYDWWMRHITHYQPIVKPELPKF